MENTHENLEHIEHTEHAAHDHFTRNVAVTMAIVAALLACVTLLSHRAHNDTLLKQMEATDEWNYYQAKNNRDRLYKAVTAIDIAMAKDPAQAKDPANENERAEWARELKKYAKELPRQKEEAKKLQGESRLAHARAMRFDLGELFVELSLVLSSIAMLTKRKEFWFSGLAAGVLGLGLALSGFFVTQSEHAAESPEAETSASSSG